MSDAGSHLFDRHGKQLNSTMYQVLLTMNQKFKVLTLLTPNPWITFIVNLSKIFGKKKKPYCLHLIILYLQGEKGVCSDPPV